MSDIGYAYIISNNEYYVITIRNLNANHEMSYDDEFSDYDTYPVNYEYARYSTDDYKIINIQNEDEKILDLRFLLEKEIVYYLSKDIVLDIIRNDIFIENKNKLNKTYSGNQKLYYSTGILKSEFYHVNGKIQGEYKEYYITGQLHKMCVYNNGNIEGEYTEYNKYGTIERIINYKDGVKNGKFTSFYNFKDKNKPQQISESGEYINGKIEGEYISYLTTGRIELKCIYKNNEIDHTLIDNNYTQRELMDIARGCYSLIF